MSDGISDCEREADLAHEARVVGALAQEAPPRLRAVCPVCGCGTGLPRIKSLDRNFSLGGPAVAVHERCLERARGLAGDCAECGGEITGKEDMETGSAPRVAHAGCLERLRDDARAASEPEDYPEPEGRHEAVAGPGVYETDDGLDARVGAAELELADRLEAGGRHEEAEQWRRDARRTATNIVRGDDVY